MATTDKTKLLVMACEYCGGAVKRASPKAKFCSNACNQASYWKRRVEKERERDE